MVAIVLFVGVVEAFLGYGGGCKYYKPHSSWLELIELIVGSRLANGHSKIIQYWTWGGRNFLLFPLWIVAVALAPLSLILRGHPLVDQMIPTGHKRGSLCLN